MQVIPATSCVSTEVYAYFKKWKSNSSYKAISKEDRIKIEESIENLSVLDNENTEIINFSEIGEQYLALASNIVALKWSKKDPKARIDINLKCDSWFNKIVTAFTKLSNLLKITIGSYNETNLESEKLLKLHDDFQKLSILQKILFEYSVALNHGGEL